MQTLQKKSFVLNADDYAMDAGVDAAILELAERGIVTSASAMALSPRWPAAGRALAEAGFSTGLHLDFTSVFARPGRTSERSITAFVMAAYGGVLDRASVRDEIERQFIRFEDVMGKAPAFVDGHRHVHQLPIIRDALVDCVVRRYRATATRVKLRSCATRSWRGIEAAFVSATGSRALEGLAWQARLATNSDFAGVYSFSGRSDLDRLWQGWLFGLAGDTPMIMCHPAKGADADAAHDPIRMARLREYRWLRSGRFQELCAETNRAPAPWS